MTNRLVIVTVFILMVALIVILIVILIIILIVILAMLILKKLRLGSCDMKLYKEFQKSFILGINTIQKTLAAADFSR